MTEIRRQERKENIHSSSCRLFFSCQVVNQFDFFLSLSLSFFLSLCLSFLPSLAPSFFLFFDLLHGCPSKLPGAVQCSAVLCSEEAQKEKYWEMKLRTFSCVRVHRTYLRSMCLRSTDGSSIRSLELKRSFHKLRC